MIPRLLLGIFRKKKTRRVKEKKNQQWAASNPLCTTPSSNDNPRGVIIQDEFSLTGYNKCALMLSRVSTNHLCPVLKLLMELLPVI